MVRIGTRGSALALAQAHEVRERLISAGVVEAAGIEIVEIKTTGDQILDRPLSEAGGKGLFTKELEEALYDRRIDLAVHSAKDMPTVLPDGLGLSAFLPREDVRDAFVSYQYPDLASVPADSVIGTASLRRQAQLRRLRPDLKVAMLRGNVITRLAKLKAGEFAGAILATAGLRRLGLAAEIRALLPATDFLPAVGQGAICIESRLGDTEIETLLTSIHDHATATALICERAFLGVLDGSCRTPIAGHATLDGKTLRFRGQVLSPDGTQSFEVNGEGASDDPGAIGRQAGEKILDEAGAELLASLRV
ncbi:MAG: hydroxymethylbilane synthase [Rhodobiaceae bacterium]|nr:hydroxymethylbilane synthase [Rhodobiaceae bacterium]MCC0055497.1 hydroxymethylbilane synthase [Rhodobiaceae bacterium]